MLSLTSKQWVAEVLISNLGLPAKVDGEYGYFSFTKVTFKKYRHRLSGNTFLTEECRLRLVNKEKADWSSRVPGAFLLSRDESRRKNDNKDNIRCEYKV